MGLFRIGLIALLIFLFFRAFALHNREEERRRMKSQQNSKDNKNTKVSKDVGEFVDYEEVD